MSTRRVKYIGIDKNLYERYKSLGPERRWEKADVHLELFYPDGRVPPAVKTGSIEDADDTVVPKGAHKGEPIEGEATRLYRTKGIVPHPLLT
jgi:hypothetical protein